MDTDKLKAIATGLKEIQKVFDKITEEFYSETKINSERIDSIITKIEETKFFPWFNKETIEKEIGSFEVENGEIFVQDLKRHIARINYNNLLLEKIEYYLSNSNIETEKFEVGEKVWLVKQIYETPWSDCEAEIVDICDNLIDPWTIQKEKDIYTIKIDSSASTRKAHAKDLIKLNKK